VPFLVTRPYPVRNTGHSRRVYWSLIAAVSRASAPFGYDERIAAALARAGSSPADASAAVSGS
jgi:hypothetical protein